jgi:hypothetical protein
MDAVFGFDECGIVTTAARKWRKWLENWLCEMGISAIRHLIQKYAHTAANSNSPNLLYHFFTWGKDHTLIPRLTLHLSRINFNWRCLELAFRFRCPGFPG